MDGTTYLRNMARKEKKLQPRKIECTCGGLYTNEYGKSTIHHADCDIIKARLGYI